MPGPSSFPAWIIWREPPTATSAVSTADTATGRGSGTDAECPTGTGNGPRPLARLTGIERSFGSVRALRGASLSLWAGEVHGILGENGAGKSTLLSVLGGLVAPDAGEVEIDGMGSPPRGAAEARRRGVGFVHQHFRLVGRMTVLENLALARDSSRHRRPMSGVRTAANHLMKRTGLSVPLRETVEGLSVGDRQRTEILKALMGNPRVLVLDEPTAVLGPLEVAPLLELLRSVASGGVAVALVAHKLDEVMAIADRVTVLRRGRTVLEALRADVSSERLAAAMVGSAGNDVSSSLELTLAAPEAARTEPDPTAVDIVARCHAVSVVDQLGKPALSEVSLTVGRGEVVGVVGVEGNGQRELARVMSGRAAPSEGSVSLPAGIGFIPQDRTREGLAATLRLVENLALSAQNKSGKWLNWPALRNRTRRVMRQYDVRAPGPRTRAGTLSGGNQQRLVVAREIEAATHLLVAENPTRGLDLRATVFVRKRLRSLAAQPQRPGILLITTDLDEAIALSDRIFVIVRGKLTPTAPSRHSRHELGRIMLGAGQSTGPVAHPSG